MVREVERYSQPARIFHWVHTGAFIVLFLTGLVFFIPALGFLAQGGWTGVVHRIAAVIFLVMPLAFMVTKPKAALTAIKEILQWGRGDIKWLKAAPRYYFLCDEKAMPPQDDMNSGQKLWGLMVFGFGLLFVVTGAVMWFGSTFIATSLMQWTIILHDIAFIATGAMLFVHIYLSVFHPLMGPRSTGAWSSMARGKVSVEYAKSHHGKWYERISRK